jgi:hypothetical protein
MDYIQKLLRIFLNDVELLVVVPIQHDGQLPQVQIYFRTDHSRLVDSKLC